MEARTTEEVPVVRVIGSSSRQETSIKVEPPIEDQAVYELCMRALHGDRLDPREADQESLDAANAVTEGVTVIQAPNTERIWEMWSMRQQVQDLFEGMEFAIGDERDI